MDSRGEQERDQNGLSALTVAKTLFGITIIGLTFLGVAIFEGWLHDNATLPVLFAAIAVYLATEKWQAILSAQAEEQLKNDVLRLNREIIRDVKKIVGDVTDVRQQVIEHLGKLKEEITDVVSKRVLTVTRVGSHRQGLVYAAERMQNARTVQDTYLRKETDKILTGYPDVADRFYKGMLGVVSRGGSVETICSRNNTGNLKSLLPEVWTFVSEKECHFRFEVWEVDIRNVPMTNLTILTYTDDSREVLFGWNFRNKDDGVVFASKDDTVIRYFDGLYNQLRTISKGIDLNVVFRDNVLALAGPK
ncbi:MAG TPA: hypothetical protein VGO49_11740 [Bradyrhizobium sp.]|jgi:hypothetical protein|nr:hypothetical protein [Bradyrhizobium sp.]